MDDILLLDTAERYLNGDLNAAEKAAFDKLRKDIPEVDQMVVEHGMFLHQMDTFGQNRQFRHGLHEIHNQLVENGEIVISPAETGGKVVQLWNKYKKVTGIAATIAGVTAVLISGLIIHFSPVPNKNELLMLSRKIAQIQRTQHVQSNQINEIKSKVPINEVPTNGGTSFLVDGKGYLITNAHVVKGSSTILVQNNKGDEFKAVIVHLDNDKDLAILKIDDEDYKTVATLPYIIRKNQSDLGEPVFTLGYPRDEIVYNEGYLSAKTGFNGDTSSCQIALSANPGNSGGPVFNRNGEVIGILSTAQNKAEGVVFALKAKNVYQAIDDLKNEDTAYAKIKAPALSKVRGLDRVQQIKQIQDCVFMVKSFTK